MCKEEDSFRYKSTFVWKMGILEGFSSLIVKKHRFSNNLKKMKRKFLKLEILAPKQHPNNENI